MMRNKPIRTLVLVQKRYPQLANSASERSKKENCYRMAHNNLISNSTETHRWLDPTCIDVSGCVALFSCSLLIFNNRQQAPPVSSRTNYVGIAVCTCAAAAAAAPADHHWISVPVWRSKGRDDRGEFELSGLPGRPFNLYTTVSGIFELHSPRLGFDQERHSCQ
eukprot:4905844-Pyramimonas_sp.AAC.1